MPLYQSRHRASNGWWCTGKSSSGTAGRSSSGGRTHGKARASMPPASCSLTTTICPNSHAHNLPEHSSPPPSSAIPPSGLPKTPLKRECGAMGRPSSNMPIDWANDTEATYFSPPQTPPTPTMSLTSDNTDKPGHCHICHHYIWSCKSCSLDFTGQSCCVCPTLPTHAFQALEQHAFARNGRLHEYVSGGHADNCPS